MKSLKVEQEAPLTVSEVFLRSLASEEQPRALAPGREHGEMRAQPFLKLVQALRAAAELPLEGFEQKADLVFEAIGL